MSLDRDDQQGGSQDARDERNEDAHVTEKNQADHTGLRKVIFLSGVEGGARKRIVAMHSVDVFEEEHTVAQGNKH